MKPWTAGEPCDVDVCLIVEGAYPYVVGGVSTWLQDLILGLPDLTFAVVALKAEAAEVPWKITPPDNVRDVREVSLGGCEGGRRTPRVARSIARITSRTLDFLEDGSLAKLAAIHEVLGTLPGWQAGEILDHPAAFAAIRDHCAARYASVSFHHYFWAVRTLACGLLATLLTRLPRARVYHTISTGYAGLLAAHARIATGRPVTITEHGIYLLEREIEILMADWIGDQVDSGLALERDAHDLRDLWRRAFDGYARTCYEACDPIISLYAANAAVQQRLGAAVERLKVIPNGIDLARFVDLADRRDPQRPVVALLGRVVPIKDVKTFIQAAALLRDAHPAARFVVLGPCDEDGDYAAECGALVSDLGLSDRLTFEGRVAIADWLPRIDVMVLTSLSEAQPLVILEAGANRIPIVATDVGSCREMIEGSGTGEPHGGIVTRLVDPQATADAVGALLSDPARRAAMGDALHDRVQRDYARETVLAAYRGVYAGGGGVG